MAPKKQMMTETVPAGDATVPTVNEKKQGTKKEQKPKAEKPKTTKNTSDGENVDVEEKQPGEKKQLSAVPMPLVKKVREELDIPTNLKNAEIKSILETFMKVIVDSVAQGDTITLPNKITFRRVLRNTRTHKNPKTKEQIIKPPHYVLAMYVKQQLKKEFSEIPVQQTDMDTMNNKAKIAEDKKNAASEAKE